MWPKEKDLRELSETLTFAMSAPRRIEFNQRKSLSISKGIKVVYI
jgi:hypothetical protein